jgi:hypothetical protein
MRAKSMPFAQSDGMLRWNVKKPPEMQRQHDREARHGAEWSGKDPFPLVEENTGRGEGR